MYAAAKSEGVLKVLDFGGSLGSTYFQNRKFLDSLKDVVWCVVEQKHFVDVGKVDFEDSRLKFYYDIESCRCCIIFSVNSIKGIILNGIKKP